MNLTYLTGPVRSGKSRQALAIADAWGREVVFVATYQCDGCDEEMSERVRRHRAERPASWRTLEAPDDVAAALAGLSPPPDGVVIDCLTLWLSARLDSGDQAIIDEWNSLLHRLRAAPFPAVIVGNEVGWSLVPENAIARRFRDLAGTLGQLTAAAASDAWLLVAGQAVRLK